MNFYLDIDGVLLNKEGKPSLHLDRFISDVSKYNIYWLTTHCKGNATNALQKLVGKVSPESYFLLLNFRPTNWNTWKTEAIDFTQDFRWLDDNIFIAEQKVLESHNCFDKFIKVDLVNNPNQLREII